MAFISDALRRDRDFMLLAIAKNPLALLCAHELLRLDEDFLERAFEVNPASQAFDYRDSPLNYLNCDYKPRSYEGWLPPIGLKASGEDILNAVAHDPLILAFASETFRSNREFMLKAIGINPSALAYASDHLKDDPKFIDLAVFALQKHEILATAAAACTIAPLLERKEEILRVIFEAVKKESSNMDINKFVRVIGDAIKPIIEASLSDFVINTFLYACKFKPIFSKAARAYWYASDALRASEEFFLQMARENPATFAFADETHQNQFSLVQDLVSSCPTVMSFTRKVHRTNRNIVLASAKSNGFNLWYADFRFSADRPVILAATSRWFFPMESLRSAVSLFDLILPEWPDDKEVVINILKLQEHCIVEVFGQVSERLRDDEDVVFEATQKNASAWELASQRLRNLRPSTAN